MRGELRAALALLQFKLLCLAASAAALQWKWDPNWPKDPGQFARLNMTIPSIAVDNTTGDVYVAQRDARLPSIFVFSRDGAQIRTLTLNVQPHAIRIQTIGTQRFLWLVRECIAVALLSFPLQTSRSISLWFRAT